METRALDLIKETFASWSDHKASRMGAALAYYTTFSIAPLFMIALSIAGLVFTRDTARAELMAQVQQMVGDAGKSAIEGMLANAAKPTSGVLAGVLGFATLLFGASGVFGELQDSMNTIWNVKPKPNSGIRDLINARFLSFVMVLGTGFLLLVSLVLSTVLTAISKSLEARMPGLDIIFQIANFVVSFGVTTVLFAMIFRVLPEIDIAWRDVWIGALITALLFVIGKALLALYIAHSAVASSYGAAGSLVIILVWVYYSSQILFLGAEFTRCYAARCGSRPQERAGVTES